MSKGLEGVLGILKGLRSKGSNRFYRGLRVYIVRTASKGSEMSKDLHQSKESQLSKGSKGLKGMF